MEERALEIRQAAPADAGGLAELTTQLGYPVGVGGMSARLERVLKRSDQVILVASDAGTGVIGWIHAAEQHQLEADPRCEILGLVVDQTRWHRGVGRHLVGAVERWALARGLAEMYVRSNILRTDSHPFYERLGYARAKTQHTYRKRLRDSGGGNAADARSGRPWRAARNP